MILNVMSISFKLNDLKFILFYSIEEMISIFDMPHDFNGEKNSHGEKNCHMNVVELMRRFYQSKRERWYD